MEVTAEVDESSCKEGSTFSGNCQHARGGAQFRPFPAYSCTICAYTVCLGCFARRTGCQAPEGESIRCHVCKQAQSRLELEDPPLFPWECEGSNPKRDMYGQLSSHRYQQRKSYREERKQVSLRNDPSTLQCTFIPLAEEQSVSNSCHVSRKRQRNTNATVFGLERPCCVKENSSFLFSVNNAGLPEELIWFLRARSSRQEIPAHHIGSCTLIPLKLWIAPPTLPGCAVSRFSVFVPEGFVSAGGRFLELHRASRIGVTDPNSATSLDSCLMRVEVLTNNHHSHNQPVEYHFAMDCLLSGRSVGVFGCGSKFEFIESLLQDSSLSNAAVHELDCAKLAHLNSSENNVVLRDFFRSVSESVATRRKLASEVLSRCDWELEDDINSSFGRYMQVSNRQKNFPFVVPSKVSDDARARCFHSVQRARFSHFSRHNKTLNIIALHNVDEILAEGKGSDGLCRLLCELVRACNTPSHQSLRLIFSFNDPDFLVRAPRDFLDVVAPQLLHLQNPHLWSPYQRELQAASWDQVVASCNLEVDTNALSNALGCGTTGSAGVSKRRALPLSETIRRVIVSLPAAFRELLRLTVQRQLELGPEVHLSVGDVLEHFEKAEIFVSHSRMRPFLQELTSNRLAEYDAATHSFVVLQPHLIKQVSDENP